MGKKLTGPTGSQCDQPLLCPGPLAGSQVPCAHPGNLMFWKFLQKSSSGWHQGPRRQITSPHPDCNSKPRPPNLEVTPPGWRRPVWWRPEFGADCLPSLSFPSLLKDICFHPSVASTPQSSFWKPDVFPPDVRLYWMANCRVPSVLHVHYFLHLALREVPGQRCPSQTTQAVCKACLLSLLPAAAPPH